MLSWQNILRNKQITADIEKKRANQGDVLRGGISRIYLYLSDKWKPCYGTINSRSRNIRTALEKYFRFHWSCKQLRIKERNSMANWEIYFQFSLKLHIQFSKYFYSIILGRLRRGYCKKNRVLEFLAKIFWLGYLSERSFYFFLYFCSHVYFLVYTS